MSGENGAQKTEQAEESTRQIVRKQPKPLSLRDPGQLARAFAESGYWKHVTKPAQAVVIMAHGEELGLSPLASMQGITIIENRIGYMGNLINQLIAKHPHYSVKKIERTNERCTLQFLIDGEPPEDEPEEGKVTFTIEDAERMELVKPRSHWVKTPRNMCFYRCLTEGSRVHFPDLTLGTPVYSTEEIEEVITEPLVVDAEVVEEEQGATPLAEDRVAKLMALWKTVEPAFEADERNVNALDGLNVMLGSLGIDGFRGIKIGFSGLSIDQADRVEEALNALAEEEANKAEETTAS